MDDLCIDERINKLDEDLVKDEVLAWMNSKHR